MRRSRGRFRRPDESEVHEVLELTHGVVFDDHKVEAGTRLLGRRANRGWILLWHGAEHVVPLTWAFAVATRRWAS